MAQQKSVPRFPVEIRPLRRAYILTSCWFALPPLIELALNRKMPSFEPLYYACLGGALLTLAYMHNKTIRLDEMGITQGFSVLSTFIRYDAIAEARKETRSAKGLSSVVLVVSERNSSRRITIPLAAFDRTKLYHALNAVAFAAPHARALIDALSWISADTP